jgi:hypothetical protein
MMTDGNVYNLTENKASTLKLEITIHFCKWNYRLVSLDKDIKYTHFREKGAI